MSAAEHPLELLRASLRADLWPHLPPGVYPVEPPCAEPQFFPGGTGMPTEPSWSDVQPGSRGLPEALPSAEGRDLMVLGNFQATVSSYRQVVDGTIGGFPVTWRALRTILAQVKPTRTFLTNAHPGLPDTGRDTAPFPMTPSYQLLCQRFLRTELELLPPRVVISLGAPAARTLARVTPELETWLPWPGFAALDDRGCRAVRCCRSDGGSFTAIAIYHPSAVRSRDQRRADAELIDRVANSS
jgi:hypothetical protein